MDAFGLFIEITFSIVFFFSAKLVNSDIEASLKQLKCCFKNRIVRNADV